MGSLAMTSGSLPVPNNRILEEARLKIAIARQHLEALKTFGMTAEWIDDLEAAADETEAVATYAQQRGEQKSLTAMKDEILEQCLQWGRNLRLRMELAFENTAPVGMNFPLKDWREAERSESKLIILLPGLIQVAQEQAESLAKFGQTPDDLVKGQTLYEQLKAANDAQEQYKLGRSTTTAERQDIFRKLYDGVNRINQLGQAVYGADTPKGLLFRSQWGLGKRSGGEKGEQSTGET